jgi:hypothetical protein
MKGRQVNDAVKQKVKDDLRAVMRASFILDQGKSLSNLGLMNFCEWYKWHWKMKYSQQHNLPANESGWNKAEQAYQQYKETCNG